jgi:hypothetical protein
MEKQKHQVGEVWRDDWSAASKWSVQFPHSIEGTRTKKAALKMAEFAKVLAKAETR